MTSLERPTTLVLLPGLDGTEILFRPFAQALPSWTTPRFVEYPPTGPNDYAALLPLVRSACGGLERFFVLGWSFSGPLALMAAAESPPGLAGVVLCASFIRPPWPMLRLLRPFAVEPVARLFPSLSRLLAIGGGYETPDLRRDKLESFKRAPPAALAARSRALLSIDVRSELRRCPVPVMYLAGSADIVVPRWNARAVQAELPSTRVVEIPGPHLALRTHPLQAAAAVTEFITRNS